MTRGIWKRFRPRTEKTGVVGVGKGSRTESELTDKLAVFGKECSASGKVDSSSDRVTHCLIS
jgi:hypothetical protein